MVDCLPCALRTDSWAPSVMPEAFSKRLVLAMSACGADECCCSIRGLCMGLPLVPVLVGDLREALLLRVVAAFGE